MDILRIRSKERLDRISRYFIRDEFYLIDWNLRLIGLKGARGIGKTTLLLQHIQQRHGLDATALYLSLDDIYFTENRLIDVAEQFHREGGKYLYLDEVHKYPNWAIEVKNLYDTYPDLQIVFTGSSIIEIHKGKADLSRRAIVFSMQGLSFRQFLRLKYGISLDALSLPDIFHHPNDIVSSFPKEFKPYSLLQEYWRHGYYPFFKEGLNWFTDRLTSAAQTVIETDFYLLHQIAPQNIKRIQQLLFVIASAPPFKPNIKKLSERIGLTRNTLLQYLYYLEQADLLAFLQAPNKGISLLQKPEKIFLENSNLLYALAPEEPNLGAIRETFVYNHLRVNHIVQYAEKADFWVDSQYTLEVGGRNKSTHQIAGQADAYILADNWDYQTGNKIPLWLIGLLY